MTDTSRDEQADGMMFTEGASNQPKKTRLLND
jgi:hypothetical protein